MSFKVYCELYFSAKFNNLSEKHGRQTEALDNYINPNASIALATFLKPAILAPFR